MTASIPGAFAKPLHRNNAADALRAWAILGVVSIHSADLVLSASQHQAVSAYFRWAVPAFIVLSTYFSVASLLRTPEPFWHFMQRRLIKIGVPFIAYSSFYFFLTADYKNLTMASTLTRHFSGYGWAGQYFFVILIQLLPLFIILSRIKISFTVLICFFVMGLVLFKTTPTALDEHLILRQLSDRPFIYWLPYAILGAFLAQHENVWRGYYKAFPKSMVLCLAATIPLLIVLGQTPTGNNSPYILPTVLVASFVLVPSSLMAFEHQWPRMVTYIGQHSMVVFCLNPFFIAMLRQSDLLHPMALSPSIWGAIIGTLGLVAAITAACLLTGEALKRAGMNILVL